MSRTIGFGLERAALAVVAAAVSLSLNCRARNDDGYVFEPQPRPLLAQAGFAPSRSARVGVSWITSGAVYLLAVLGEGDETRLTLIMSEDGGDSVGPPVPVSENGKRVSSQGENSPALLVTPEQICAAWTEGGDLLFARSLSWGESFEKPLKIADKSSNTFSGYPSIGVAPDGSVYAVWIDTRDQITDSDDNYAVYLVRSGDRGASFGKNVRVASRICPCCRPTLAFGARGEVLVFWRHIFPGSIHDMAVAVSTDGGKTFTPAKRIAEDNWKIDGCPDSGPAAVRSGNRIYVAWLTEASTRISGVRMTWSDDAGGTWAAPVLASQGVLDANYPSLSVADDGRVLLSFQGRDPDKKGGWDKTGVHLVEIRADGRPGPPVAIPGMQSSAARPTVAAGTGGRVHIVWTGTHEGKPAVFLSRARRRTGV